MNDFMLIYKGGDPDWMKNSSREDMAAAMERWGAWMADLEKKGQLTSGGSPLEFSGKLISSGKVITDMATSEFKELVTGYSIVKADDIDGACELALACPIFDYPNITVEVRPVPNMG